MLGTGKDAFASTQLCAATLVFTEAMMIRNQGTMGLISRESLSGESHCVCCIKFFHKQNKCSFITGGSLKWSYNQQIQVELKVPDAFLFPAEREDNAHAQSLAFTNEDSEGSST